VPLRPAAGGNRHHIRLPATAVRRREAETQQTRRDLLLAVAQAQHQVTGHRPAEVELDQRSQARAAGVAPRQGDEAAGLERQPVAERPLQGLGQHHVAEERAARPGAGVAPSSERGAAEDSRLGGARQGVRPVEDLAPGGGQNPPPRTGLDQRHSRPVENRQGRRPRTDGAAQLEHHPVAAHPQQLGDVEDVERRVRVVAAGARPLTVDPEQVLRVAEHLGDGGVGDALELEVARQEERSGAYIAWIIAGPHPGAAGTIGRPGVEPAGTLREHREGRHSDGRHGDPEGTAGELRQGHERRKGITRAAPRLTPPRRVD